MANRNELLKPKEVAAELGISRLSVYRAISSGKLEAVRIGSDAGPLRVSREAVSALLYPTGSTKEASP
jgi:excisionase family DNA binding protein